MPPHKRSLTRSRRPEVEELTIDIESELIHGRPMLGKGCHGDIELLREAWEIHRDVVLPEYIAKNPGCRPFAWWVLEHGEERPIIQDLPEGEKYFRRQYERYGFLHSMLYGGPDFGPFQEEEWDYLDRLGLLSAEEVAAIEAENAAAASEDDDE